MKPEPEVFPMKLYRATTAHRDSMLDVWHEEISCNLCDLSPVPTVLHTLNEFLFPAYRKFSCKSL